MSLHVEQGGWLGGRQGFLSSVESMEVKSSNVGNIKIN